MRQQDRQNGNIEVTALYCKSHRPGVRVCSPGFYETLDPGIVPGPACLEQKPEVFAQEARHLRRRGTSLCLAIHSYRFMARSRAERDGRLVRPPDRRWPR